MFVCAKHSTCGRCKAQGVLPGDWTPHPVTSAPVPAAAPGFPSCSATHRCTTLTIPEGSVGARPVTGAHTRKSTELGERAVDSAIPAGADGRGLPFMHKLTNPDHPVATPPAMNL
ncbi:hypothetical protein RRG08_007573 [Elysia crispata]|uniref:Uncharacterized protein n=1 Tax=Elysia crispata TaxID=231223 RepID=A0AAE1E838_9GAST|nr:hypothetical protein RRG08_007573 [Elysia crispata]